MKKLILLACVMALSVAQALSLAEARGKIGDCIASPKTMAATMKQLSAEDQIAFLADINEAIASMPGSEEQKAATFIAVNKSALTSAAKGNVTAMLAETFATVPVDMLPAISEALSSDLLNRNADPTRKYDDEKFTKIAETIMKKVAERVASADDGEKRAAIAAATMLKSAGEATPEMTAAIIGALPEESREAAEKSVPEMVAGNYEGVTEPEYEIELAIRMTGTHLHEMVLADIDEGIFHMSGSYNAHDSSHLFDAENVIPMAMEPHGYQGQYLD